MGHGQGSVLMPVGKKGAGPGNRIRTESLPFILEIGSHSDLGCMWDDRDSCGVIKTSSYSFCTTLFVCVCRRSFYVAIFAGFVLY